MVFARLRLDLERIKQMIKNNLGWIVALILVAGQPVLSAAPQLCLWDMYAMASIVGCCSHSGTTWVTCDRDMLTRDYCAQATAIANEMIKRRSK